eukprot:5979559-Pyramimonas_sp.AAC.1
MMTPLAHAHADFQVEPWGISSACLQGLKFDEMTRNPQMLGLGIRGQRHVHIMPPAIVWRHLRDFSKLFDIPDSETHLYVLECIKPVPGLVDAP